MTYRDRLLTLALQWKYGAQAERIAALLPQERPVAIGTEADPAARLRQLARRESSRVNTWGRKRFGAAWDRLEPRVKAELVKQHGRHY